MVFGLLDVHVFLTHGVSEIFPLTLRLIALGGMLRKMKFTARTCGGFLEGISRLLNKNRSELWLLYPTTRSVSHSVRPIFFIKTHQVAATLKEIN